METPSMANFKNLLVYPFKDKDSSNKIIFGSLLIFASLIIPVLPLLFVLGYIMHIVKRIIDGDGQLGLPKWAEWSEYLKDGLKWFVVLLLYSVPVIILFFVGYFVYFLSFISLAAFEESANPSLWVIILPFFGMAILFLTIFVAIVLAMIEFIVLPAGFMHVVHTQKISSAFMFKEWLPILKKNFLGFMVAIIFSFGFYYFMLMAFSALYMSVVFCFVIPFTLAPLTFLMWLWTIPLFAQAYKDGRPVVLETDTSEDHPK